MWLDVRDGAALMCSYHFFFSRSYCCCYFKWKKQRWKFLVGYKRTIVSFNISFAPSILKIKITVRCAQRQTKIRRETNRKKRFLFSVEGKKNLGKHSNKAATLIIWLGFIRTIFKNSISYVGLAKYMRWISVHTIRVSTSSNLSHCDWLDRFSETR